MNGSVLAIDFGTTYTWGAVRLRGRTELLRFELDTKFPSAVGLLEGRLVVGEAALALATRCPEALELSPKRHAGERSIVLGDERLEVSDALAAIFARVLEAALAVTAPDRPTELRLTHPARWTEARLSSLREAAAAIGFADPVLVPQPVAVALSCADARVAEGQHVAVYDLGGSIFEAAVLRRTAEGFMIVGEPAGLETAGEEFDDLLAQLIRDRLTREQWAQVRVPELRRELRRAKEELSTAMTATIHMPGLDEPLTVARPELEALVSGVLTSTVQELERAIASANLTPSALAVVYLAGAPSRFPLVGQLVSRQLGVTPRLVTQPAVVGALFEHRVRSAQAPSPAPSRAPASSSGGKARVVGQGGARAIGTTPPTAALAQAMASQATAHAGDSVDCAIFAPSQAAPGALLMVQVFLHAPGQAEQAAALATAFDPDASRRGFRGLELPLPRGSTVEIELKVTGAQVEEPVQRLVWQGRAEAVQFDLLVPVGYPPGPLPAHAVVRRDGVPIGRVGFRIAVAAASGTEIPVAQVGDQRRFVRAFASYASADRHEVLKRVQVLRAAGIECFQDVLDLEPGQRWERELYRRIDSADLFLLFWSRAAKRSEWVRREAQYALERQHGDPEKEPEICPVLLPAGRLHRHRTELPWEELSHLHFNDLVTQVL